MVNSISILIPSFNEEENIQELYERIIKTLDEIHINDYEIIFINNGSYDNSLTLLKKINISNNKVKIVSLSRNFGYQNAILAGLNYSKKDYACILDGDLQDPPETIKDFVLKARKDLMLSMVLEKKDKQVFLKRLIIKFFIFFIKN